MFKKCPLNYKITYTKLTMITMKQEGKNGGQNTSKSPSSTELSLKYAG